MWLRMTVAIISQGMTSEYAEENQESTHGFNFFIDRQLQNKLLQADDDLLAEKEPVDNSLYRNNLKSGKLSKNDTRNDFTGWFPDQKLVCRKLDGANKTDQKPRESTFIHPWKDYKRNREESYVFKHYTDTRKYIEQYRKEHNSHSNRFSSSGLDRPERRYAYPSPAPQNPVQVQVQALWKGIPTSAPENPALHYTNRKDNLGTLVTPTPNSNCNCSKVNHSHTESTSQAHRYKLVPSPFARTPIVDVKSQHGDSDNSSESGDSRAKTPRSRISSAASVKGRAIAKALPTKISVPAQGVHNGVRPYPIQALTIQQTSSKSSDPAPASSPKPLDNLNVVAPEKQAVVVGRKEVEPIAPALQVHSFNNLLSSNEAPLRGYAVRSQSPQTKPSDVIATEDLKDRDLSPETDSDCITGGSCDAVSIDRLSTCPLSADVRVKHKIKIHTSQMLQMFLKDPVLSKLNKRPPLNDTRSTLATSEYVNQGTLPQNDADAMYRVNMWNPVVSTPPKSRASTGNGNLDLRNSMHQKPFRKSTESYVSASSSFGKTYQIVHDLHDKGRNGNKIDKKDYFHPVKKIKLSITRLDNAVSFCRAQVQPKDELPFRKSSSAKASDSSSDRLTKAVYRSEHSNTKCSEINLSKDKIFENIHRKISREGPEGVAFKHDNNRQSHYSEAELPDMLDSNMTVKESLINAQSIKHVSFCDNISDEPYTKGKEKEVNGTDFQDANTTETNSKLVYCPPIKQQVSNNIESKTLKSKLFEKPPATERNSNDVNAKHAEIQYFKDEILEKSVTEDDGKPKNIRIVLETEQSGMKNEINLYENCNGQPQLKSDKNAKESELSDPKYRITLPKPSFGMACLRNKNGQERETMKEVQGTALHKSGHICNTPPLTGKRADAQNWRLSSVENQMEEKGRQKSKDNLDVQGISSAVIHGNKIMIENEKIKDEVQGIKEFDEQSPRSSLQSGSGKRNGRRVKKTALASGKRLHEHPDLDGLTWAEKLEVLRSVNKRPEKAKPKPQKLRFVKDEPDVLPSSDHEQLYEQRRIKHLVEQARIKGGKQFDWVHEARVRARGIDWTSEKTKTETEESSEHDCSDQSSIGSEHGEESGGERKFGKYGIYVPQKGASQKLFDCHNITRSNTYISS